MILNDRQIDILVKEKQMIVPYVASQVSKGVISYGLSSFGYDFRCGNKFKVFHNAHNCLVDPKQLKSDAYVEVEDDFACTIPPNGFALAYTIERFKMSEDVMGICIGKSTYARCFSGDTQIALANGTSITFKHMIERTSRGERFFGYGFSEKLGGIVVTELKHPRAIAHNEELVQVALDDDSVIKCTPDHMFLTREGVYVQAQYLKRNTRLMPLHRFEHKGREILYQPDLHDCNQGNLVATYRLADDWNIRNDIYAYQESTHRHHKDRNKRNDYPTNIERLDGSFHTSMHNAEYYDEDVFDSSLHSARIKEALTEKFKDPAWRAHYIACQSKRAKDFWTLPKYKDIRNALSKKKQRAWTPEKRKRRSKALQRFFASPEGKALLNSRVMPVRKQLDEERVKDLLERTGSIKQTALQVGCSWPTLKRRFPDLIRVMREEGRLPTNHRVKSVTHLTGKHTVYCLTAPETGNFALESGVIVRNCGIIINVTPIEPGWEGHITLEISNTTPNPCIIYANEGIGQLMFFRGEAPDITYNSRHGKYQNQPADIVLPRVVK